MGHDVKPQGDDEFAPTTDDLLRRNQAYVEAFDDGVLPVQPFRKMAIVACMDSRMDMFAILGLEHGAAHVIRNAGGVITDDVIRSLTLSQRFLGTREIVLMHHTDCGLATVDEDSLRDTLQAETGVKPWWSFEAFRDPYVDTQQSMRRLKMSPFLLDTAHVRGFVYDVATGALHEVTIEGD